LSPGLAVGVLLLFAIVFSVIFGAFGLVEAWVARRSRLTGLALSPFLVVSLEAARTYFLTGVPWNLLGYAVQPSGLSQLASVTAVYGLSFLAVATSALLASALLAGSARWSWSIPTFWFVLLIVVNSAYRPPMSPPESEDAYLLQPDVPLDEAAAKEWSPSADQGRHLGGLVNASLAAACKGFPARSEMSIAVPICYEDIFPQLVRRLTPQGPGVLVNISNDSWYGDSSAAFQHLEMSRYRAIENGRYLL